MITKEWLYQLYIIENKSWLEISKLAGCSSSTIGRLLKSYDLKKDVNAVVKSRQATNLQKYGVENPAQSQEIREKTKKTNLERYGCENPMENEEIKERLKKTVREMYGVDNAVQSLEIQEKIKKTNLEKYGYENPVQNLEVQKKIKETTLEKYGTEFASQNQEIKNKVKATVKKKFNVDYVLQSPEIKEQIKKTNLEKYGTETPLQNEEVKEKIKKTMVKKYGVENPSQSSEIKAKVKKTKIEQGQAELVFDKFISIWALEYHVPATNLYKWKKLNPDCTKEEFVNYLETYQTKLTDIENIAQQLGYQFYNKYPQVNFGYKPDFKLSDKIYLNVDGLYYHSELCKSKNYHFEMRKHYEKNDLRIFQFRADEIENKKEIVQSMLNNSLGLTPYKIGARKTIVKVVSTAEAIEFLNKNHIKGYRTSRHIGLYFENELVSLMSYKKSKDRKTKETFLKIERFCSKNNYNIVGAVNKLLKVIESTVGPMPIHYWVDLRYGSGTYLTNHGFQLEKETLGWEWTDFEKTYNRLKCRANMDDRKLTEKEHAEELGWVRIYDAGQRLFVKK